MVVVHEKVLFFPCLVFFSKMYKVRGVEFYIVHYSVQIEAIKASKMLPTWIIALVLCNTFNRFHSTTCFIFITIHTFCLYLHFLLIISFFTHYHQISADESDYAAEIVIILT